MPEIPLPIDQILAHLSATPPRLAELTSALPPALLSTPPAPGEWSANEVLAHLRACADQWGGCITAILTQDRPTLRAINPRTWIKSTDYLELEFWPSLEAFTQQRADLLALLEALPPEGWARSATIIGAGAPLERTAQFYAQWLARHERPHVKQIEGIVKTISLGD